MIKLKNLLLQSQDYNLDQDIETYFTIQKQLQAKRALIQQQLDQLEAMDKSLSTRVKKIQDYMEKNQVSQRRVKQWVARLSTVAKYKRVAPDYKQMWGEALKKVNEATRRVLEQIKIANEQAKRAATKIELQLVEEGIMDIVKNLFSKFVGLFKAFDSYEKVSNSLPQIKQ